MVVFLGAHRVYSHRLEEYQSRNPTRPPLKTSVTPNTTTCRFPSLNDYELFLFRWCTIRSRTSENIREALDKETLEYAVRPRKRWMMLSVALY